MRVSIAVVTVLMLASACDRSSSSEATPPASEPPASEPPPPADPPPEQGVTPEQPDAPVESKLSAGNPNICEPVAFTECPPGTSHPGVDETLEAAPSGVVTIVGVVEETETRCTNSEPPSCMSSLALRDRPGGPGSALLLAGQPGGTQYTCDGCCTLAPNGTRYAVTGTILSHAGPKMLVVESVCQLP